MENLNLIANYFSDSGMHALSLALAHPAAYTRTLLVGRNKHFGEGGTIALVTTIQQQSPPMMEYVSLESTSNLKSGYAAMVTALSYAMAEKTNTTATGTTMTMTSATTGLSFGWNKHVRHYMEDLALAIKNSSDAKTNKDSVTALESLELSGTDLDDRGLVQLTKTLN